MSGHALFITHRTAPGQRDAVRSVWEKHMVPAVAGNPDHLAYYYCLDVEDADMLRVFQLYRDAAAAEAFLRHPNYSAYLAEVERLLAGPPEVHTATPAWHKPQGEGA